MWNPDEPDYECTPVNPQRPRFGYAPADPNAAPFVSIVTPYYNAGDQFEPTAQSVLRQSFQQWEWLIVDDGTTDEESLAVLTKYEGTDPRIRVIHQENAGPSAARNRGYEAARADYVAQIDADDLLEPTAIEKWLWFLTSYPEFGFVKGYAVGFQAEEFLWNRGFHTPQFFFTANPAQPNSMIKKAVHEEAGGYDESNRAGFEDWDFWFRCAEKGHWGGVIPEYLDWYRRRESHNDRWDNWDGDKRQREFVVGLKRKFPRLFKEGMPKVPPQDPKPFDIIPDKIPCENRLAHDKKRILMVIPWMQMGGSDRFTLDLVRELTARGWEVSIATTLHGANDWQHEFTRYTPDVFILENFLNPRDFPRFLHYLIRSRQIDTVLVTHSVAGYLFTPFLRSRCPETTFVDYCHIEEHEWLNGGYPRFGAGLQECLDLNIVSSEHLKRWMTGRGADPASIEVCYTSIDADDWRPDPEKRAEIRDELGIDPNACVLVYPARLCDQKQPRAFAEVLRQVRDRGGEFVALVAGEGEHAGWLNRFVRKHDLQGEIRMLGKVSADRVHGLMAASDVLFLPSKWEGIALSVYESMATGLVVVTANVGGHAELVTEATGFLADVAAPEVQIPKYVEILSGLIGDRAKRERMGRAARDRVVSSFGMREMAQRMEALFAKAAQRGAARHAPVGKGTGREFATLGLEYLRLQDLAAHPWQTREDRLGMRRTLRGRLLDVAYRAACRLPPWPREVLARAYRRWFVPQQ